LLFSYFVLPSEVTKDVVLKDDVYLLGDCHINRGVRVRILPGAKFIIGDERNSFKILKKIGKRQINVAVDKKATLVVEGELVVEGSYELPVFLGRYFENDASGIKWGGIAVVGDGKIYLENTKVENAFFGVLLGGNSQGILKHTEISNCAIGIIAANSSELHIADSKILRNVVSGIEIYDNGNIKVESCRISENKINGILSKHHGTLELQKSIVTENKVGLRLKDASQWDLKENKIYNNQKNIESVRPIEIEKMKPEKADYVWDGFVEISEDFVVPYGGVLKIEPGTKIYISTYSALNYTYNVKTQDGEIPITDNKKCEIIVKGKIYINGTSDRKVTIFPSNNFGGFILASPENSVVKGLAVSGGEKIFYLVNDSKTLFKDTSFEDTNQAVVLMEVSQGTFENTKFANCNYGVLIYDNADVNLENCRFANCRISVGALNSSKTEIYESTFEKNEVAFLGEEKARLNLRASRFFENKTGVFLKESAFADISENSFSKNTTGIFCSPKTSVFIVNNVFAENENAVLKDINARVDEEKNNFLKNAQNSEFVETKNPTTKGVLYESEVWEGEIVLEGDILVKKGITLYIKDGTKVVFSPSKGDFNYFADIQGQDVEITNSGLVDIIVEGDIRVEDGEKTVFSSKGGGAIIFTKEGEGRIISANFKNLSGLSLFDKSFVQIENTIFENIQKGISLRGNSHLVFKKSRILDSENGISVFENGILDISLSRVKHFWRRGFS